MNLREIDKLIAEHIFGHIVVETRWGKEKQYSCLSIGEPFYFDIQGDMQLSNPLPLYSENIENAWEIVNKLSGVFTLTSNNPYHPTSPETEWLASFDAEFEREASTPSLAICLAALKAKGIHCEPS